MMWYFLSVAFGIVAFFWYQHLYLEGSYYLAFSIENKGYNIDDFKREN